MTSLMRVSVVGLGSIGKRHLSVLRQIADVKAFTLDTGKGKSVDRDTDVRDMTTSDWFSFFPDIRLYS